MSRISFENSLIEVGSTGKNISSLPLPYKARVATIATLVFRHLEHVSNRMVGDFIEGTTTARRGAWARSRNVPASRG